MKAPGFDCDGAKRRKVVLGPKASRPWGHHFRQFLGCPRKDEGMTNHSSFDEEKAKELRRLERICRKWTYSFAGRLSRPITRRYAATPAVFQLSIVSPQTAHSKLAIWRLGAIVSVRL